MHKALLLLLAQLCSLGGMAGIALAMDEHREQVLGSTAGGVPWRMRLLGGAALLLSFVLCLRADHASIAVLVWVMSLAVAACGVAFALAWWPRRR